MRFIYYQKKKEDVNKSKKENEKTKQKKKKLGEKKKKKIQSEITPISCGSTPWRNRAWIKKVIKLLSWEL